MRYYVRAEIERFLRAVDLALKRPATIIVIGGGAAALKYRIDDPTTDIDTFKALGPDLRRAIDAARKATALAMPFEQSGVADGPYDFEDRVRRVMPRLARLTVLVPERHDLALMKTLRGDQADFAKLQAIHEREPFDLSVLLERGGVLALALTHTSRILSSSARETPSPLPSPQGEGFAR